MSAGPDPRRAPSPDDDELDLGAARHVLGLEDEDARLVADPRFPAAVAAWRERLGELDRAVPPAPADEALWRRIEASLDAPRAQSTPAPARPRDTAPLVTWIATLWRSLTLWRAVGFAAAAAALLLALSLSARPAPPVFVAVLVTGENRPGALVDVYADGHAELVPLAALNVPADRILQVWTLWDAARGPVSLGLLDRARQARLPVGDLPPTRADQLFEITLEPRTGSPTGRPTGPILMKGTALPTL